jgi:type IV pilus assembly protein PilY1
VTRTRSFEDQSMRFSKHPLLIALTSIGLVLSSAARADDTEIFTVTPATSTRPNIMLIIDTSGSMNEVAVSTPLPFNPATTYGEGDTDCDNLDRVYYTTSATPPTSCNNLPYVSYTNTLRCQPARTALGTTGTGYYTDLWIRWGGTGSNRGWSSNLGVQNAALVECRADNGVDGNNSTAAPYPSKLLSNNSSGVWTATSTSSWWSVSGNTGTSYTFYSANYIRYNADPPTADQRRIDVVKAAAASFLNSLPNVNLGVMRYSTNNHQYGNNETDAKGGMVVSEVSELEPKRASLITSISSPTGTLFVPQGYTPLSETLFEAYRYFAGGAVEFGSNSRVCTSISNATSGNPGNCTSSGSMQNYPSVAAAISGSNYVSPATEPCQANYVIYLTDGLPFKDSEANTLMSGITDFASVGGGCLAAGTGPNSGDRNAGLCLGALAQYMFNKDLRPVDGTQNVRTYFIGFGADFDGSLTGAFDYLQNAADRGGGQAYQANDLTGLSAVFNSIITSILQTSTTFTTPTVAVNAFNRTQTLQDLFVSVFQPNSSVHWPGNLKKYRVTNGQIMDNNSPPQAAVDPDSGFFASGSRSFWSSVTDGAEVELGGAASRLGDPTNRNVYTFIGTNPTSPTAITGTAYRLNTANGAVTSTLLGLGAAGDPSRDDLINWARGVDIRNEDGDAATTIRQVMGDPIHSPPAMVIYGGTVATPNINDAAVFLATNDGYLHAINPTNGDELWSFVPQEFLPSLKALYFNNPTASKQYKLDGEIQILKYDVNGDGIVDGANNDRVILYVGTGRGGSNYYALDVTDKTAPKYMWTLGTSPNGTALPGIGQAWSTPTIARVNINGATQNSQKLVLIMGGGYDPAEDGAVFSTQNTVGNRLYIVDALRGSLLWSAGLTNSGASLELDRMTHSIPGGIAVLDTNTDGLADRMYAGDVAAQVWRFDITNGNNAATLVAGGVMASLGTKDDATPVAADARRFYSRPDVAALQRPDGPPFLNIAIGSGFRGHPLNTATRDRFYAIRDLAPRQTLTQTQYNDATILVESDLTDVTTDTTPSLAIDSRGWRLMLNQPSWQGEKSLSPSTTFDNKTFFTTYLPPPTSAQNSCLASSTGSNRAYVVNAFNGAPVPRDTPTDPPDPNDPNGGDPDPEDRYDELAQGGIAPEVSFLFPEPNEVLCLSGVEVLDVCTNFNSRIKTYWRESTAN